ncbi:MAG: hypothetical protein VZS12_02215 [Ruminococcus bromii]|nr:hypothetical protein [Ruminococcus bromii]
MTTKEMLNIIISGGEITEEVKAKATEMLAAQEKKNGKRAEASAENRSANAALAAEIVALMTDGQTLSAAEILPLIAEAHPDINKAKIAAVMAVGAEDGLVTINPEYKEGGKGRKKNGYTKVAAE